jgi:hypothetical protein
MDNHPKSNWRTERDMELMPEHCQGYERDETNGKYLLDVEARSTATRGNIALPMAAGHTTHVAPGPGRVHQVY